MNLSISLEDIKWLSENYPRLKYINQEPALIKGTIDFGMLYLGDHYLINSLSPQDLNHPLYIKDSYEIEITLQTMPASILPSVREINGRIKKAKDKHYKENLADVHMYPSEHLCLCTHPEENIKLPNGFLLKDFFNHLLIPYFYGQSHFEKTGNWIFGERSHGCLGIFESYFDFRTLYDPIGTIKKYINDLKINSDIKFYKRALVSKQKIKGHWPCFCGSQKRFRNCHNLAFKGLWSFKEDLRFHKLSMNLLFTYPFVV